MNEKQSQFGQQVQEQLEAADVFWLYQGAPRKEAPHASLTSGQHSDGFVIVGKVLKGQPTVRMAFAGYILATLRQAWNGSFGGVAGADTSSTDLAGDIARITGADHIRMVKTEDAQGKRQVWHPENTPLQDGVTILHIEELITTSLSALQVREGIRRANPGATINFVPFLPVVVERSNPEDRVVQVEDSKVLPLLQLCIRNFNPNPSACPYCAAGSEALKPKHGDNWSKLTGKGG